MHIIVNVMLTFHPFSFSPPPWVLSPDVLNAAALALTDKAAESTFQRSNPMEENIQGYKINKCQNLFSVLTTNFISSARSSPVMSKSSREPSSLLQNTQFKNPIQIWGAVPDSGIETHNIYVLISSVNNKWGWPYRSLTAWWWRVARRPSEWATAGWWRAELHSSYSLTDPRRGC